jgi:hydroxymethylglutaryl-CoA reductase
MLDEALASAIRDRSSRLPGFHKLPLADRRAAVAAWAGLLPEEAAALDAGLSAAAADVLVENVAGTFALPLGIATNFVVNGRDVLVPMAIEEPSVVAAASHGALLVRAGGGLRASADDAVMIGQIQLLDLPRGDLAAAEKAVLDGKAAVLALADAQNAVLPALGGGAKDLRVRRLDDTPAGPMLVVHLHYDTRDAMGANSVNTACEAVAPLLESITGGRALLRILSNLADLRLARAECRVPAHALDRPETPGTLVTRRIVEAAALGAADPYRAATNNKGIMNGVDAVVLATGNDWRAAEAGAHAYAARGGRYRSLAEWRQDADGGLVGQLEMPLALGTVGGTTRSHPAAQACLKILGVSSARDLAEIAVSVGLVQNLAALRALASEGIQAGHMALHARQLAVAAGADGAMAVRVADRLVAEGKITPERAAEILGELAGSGAD